MNSIIKTLRLQKSNLRGIKELDESLLYADQPECTLASGIRLKKHQLTALYRCLQLEKKEIIIENEPSNDIVDENSIIEQDDENYMMKISSKIGFLCDITGAGKSYVILSLIASEFVPSQESNLFSICSNKILIKYNGKSEELSTSLLLVPSSICSQWGQYIKDFLPASFKSCVLTNKRQIVQLFDNGLDYYNLIVMSPNFYKHFLNYTLGTDLETKVFRRIIIDEVDSILVPKLLKAKFYWYITASINNIKWPMGNTHRNIQGFKFPSSIRNDLYQLSNDIMLNASPFIVKNSNRYIAESIKLPEMVIHKILCATPISIRVLSGVVDRKIIEYLNANDFKNALNCYGISQVTSEENIIELFVEKLKHSIENIRRTKEFKQNGGYIYENEDEKQQDINALKKEEVKLTEQMKNIQERIKKTVECSICYETISANKTILDCCSNAFCFRCIHKWLAHSDACPFCKTKLDQNRIFIVDDNEDSQIHNSIYESVNEYKTKEQNLKSIIMQKRDEQPSKKILIFSKYDINSSLQSWLSENNINWNELKGNKHVFDNIIDQYKYGNTQILFLNPLYFGSGLNLENTTDLIILHKIEQELEKQVIGRAQRYGRTSSLRLWYLFHKNEFSC